MRNTDQGEFVRVLNALAVIKPGGKLTDEALDLWWLSMQDWSIEEFRAAAAHLAKSVPFMPSPYDFNRLRKASEMTAVEAWSEVLRGAELEPGSRMARAAQLCGGQQAIRHANIERDLPHIQRRFKEIYEELSESQEARAALGALPDLSETLPALPDQKHSAPEKLQ